MIKIDKLNFFKFLAIISLNIFFVLSFYALFKLDKSSQNYSLVHAIMSGVLILQLGNVLKKSKKISLGFLLVYVLCMYFQFSMIKYCRVGVFYGFSKDNRIRFQGTIIVFVILFFVNKVQQFSSKGRDSAVNPEIEEKPAGYKLWVWIISSFLLVYYFLIYDYTNSIYDSANYHSQSKVVELMLSITIVVGIYLTVFYLDVHRPITYFPLFFDMISITYYAMRTGSRAQFFAYALLALYMLVENRILKYRWFTIAQLAAPWFMIVFTYISFWVSGRYSSDFAKVTAMNIAYRFDLSDLAVNILNNTSWFRFDFSEILGGLQNCIPSFVTTRHKGFVAYHNMLSEAHLIAAVDYSDTFFSMGASVGGVIGMILIVPILYIIYEIIDQRLSKQSNKGILIKMICILSLTRIETVWISFIPEMRNLIFTILIIAIAFKVISMKYLMGGQRI